MAACRARRRHLDVDVSVDVLEVSSFFCPNFLLEKEKMCEERRRDDDGEKVRATRAFFLATAAACVLDRISEVRVFWDRISAETNR